MTFALLLLLACTTRSSPQATDPVSVGDQVAMRLTEAALLRQQGDAVGALESWAEAHADFEAVLEEPLRTRCGDRCTTELEYGFARVRRAIDEDHRDTVATADTLGVRIQEAVSTLVDTPKSETP